MSGRPQAIEREHVRSVLEKIPIDEVPTELSALADFWTRKVTTWYCRPLGEYVQVEAEWDADWDYTDLVGYEIVSYRLETDEEYEDRRRKTMLQRAKAAWRRHQRETRAQNRLSDDELLEWHYRKGTS